MDKTPRPIIGYDLTDGSRHTFASMRKAAQIALGLVNNCARSVWTIVEKRPHRSGWLFIYAEHEEELAGWVAEMQDKWNKGNAKTHKNPNASRKRLVSLRVDKHTVILVTPDKATEEYAELWRQRHEHDQRITDRNYGGNTRRR